MTPTAPGMTLAGIAAASLGEVPIWAHVSTPHGGFIAVRLLGGFPSANSRCASPVLTPAPSGIRSFLPLLDANPWSRKGWRADHRRLASDDAFALIPVI
jgi:hypothetical protein